MKRGPRNRPTPLTSPRSAWRLDSRASTAARATGDRKAIVEPVIGWIKQVLGFRRFSLRGETRCELSGVSCVS